MLKQLLERYNWNLLFMYFPMRIDKQFYCIYRNKSSVENELLGSGSSSDEAILAAWKKE